MIKLLGEKANKAEIDAVVREADANGDGTVDFEGEGGDGLLVYLITVVINVLLNTGEQKKFSLSKSSLLPQQSL